VRKGVSLRAIGCSGMSARLSLVRASRGADVGSRGARPTAPTIEPRIPLMGDIGLPCLEPAQRRLLDHQNRKQHAGPRAASQRALNHNRRARFTSLFRFPP
jgi:hypothetical protein